MHNSKSEWIFMCQTLIKIHVYRNDLFKMKILKGYYNVVMISTDGSFEDTGVMTGDDGGCLRMPGLPTVFLKTISMFDSAAETWYRFSIKIL